MNLEDIQSHWQQHVPTKTEHTIVSAETFAKIEKKAKERAVYGTIAFLLLTVFFGFLLHLLYITGSSNITIFAVVWWTLVLLANAIHLLVIRKQLPAASEAVLEHLARKLSVLSEEVSFYSNLWKYLTLPLGGGLCVLLYSLLPMPLIMLSGLLVIYSLCAWLGHRHCKKMVTTSLLPVIQGIEQNLASYSAKNSTI